MKNKGFIKWWVVVFIIIGICANNKINSYSIKNVTEILSTENKEIDFNISEYNRYIDIKMKLNSDKDVSYDIIDPKGNVVKSSSIKGEEHFFGASSKGEWKIRFSNIDSEKNIDYSIWTGNLKSKDTLRGNVSKVFT